MDFDNDALGFLFIPTPLSRAHQFKTDVYTFMYFTANMPRLEDLLAYDISNLTLWMALRFSERLEACRGLHKKVLKKILLFCASKLY